MAAAGAGVGSAGASGIPCELRPNRQRLERSIMREYSYTYSHEVFDGAVRVVEAGTHGPLDLLAREPHADHLVDARLEGRTADERSRRVSRLLRVLVRGRGRFGLGGGGSGGCRRRGGRIRHGGSRSRVSGSLRRCGLGGGSGSRGRSRSRSRGSRLGFGL